MHEVTRNKPVFTHFSTYSESDTYPRVKLSTLRFKVAVCALLNISVRSGIWSSLKNKCHTQPLGVTFAECWLLLGDEHLAGTTAWPWTTRATAACRHRWYTWYADTSCLAATIRRHFICVTQCTSSIQTSFFFSFYSCCFFCVSTIAVGRSDTGTKCRHVTWVHRDFPLCNLYNLTVVPSPSI